MTDIVFDGDTSTQPVAPTNGDLPAVPDLLPGETRVPRQDGQHRIKQLLSERKRDKNQLVVVTGQRDRALADLNALRADIEKFKTDEAARLEAAKRTDEQARVFYTSALIDCARTTGVVKYCSDWDKRVDAAMTKLSTTLLREVLAISRLALNPASLLYAITANHEACAKLSELCKTPEGLGEAVRFLCQVAYGQQGESMFMSATQAKG